MRQISDTEGSEVWIDATAGQKIATVPGTVWADLERDLSHPGDPKDGGRHPLPALEDWCRTLGQWGIDPNTTVRVFDHRGGGLAAARCWWMLRAVGHSRVFLMDGPPSSATRVEARPDYPATRWRAPVVHRGDVVAALDDREHVVLDARSEARHQGVVEPLDPVAGCLPGSVNLPWERLRVDGRWAADLSSQVRQAIGAADAGKVVVSCGSGVTACVLAAAMSELGLGMPALYVGSWSEWCRHE